MRASLVILLALLTCGCKTAFIYTGSVKAGDNQKAVAVAKTIEVEFVRQGLKIEPDFPAESGAFYSCAWVKPIGDTRRITLWAGDWVKDETLFIRIVPQPYCDDVSRDVGEHVREFMTRSFTDLEWTLNARSELDWFR